jgi:hypothetical protein
MLVLASAARARSSDMDERRDVEADERWDCDADADAERADRSAMDRALALALATDDEADHRDAADTAELAMLVRVGFCDWNNGSTLTRLVGLARLSLGPMARIPSCFGETG